MPSFKKLKKKKLKYDFFKCGSIYMLFEEGQYHTRGGLQAPGNECELADFRILCRHSSEVTITDRVGQNRKK